MFKRRKQKGFFYYFKVLIYVLLAGAAVYYGNQEFSLHKNKFDADEILNNSILKNKKFAADVKQVEADGLSAYLMEEHSNPIVSINFMFRNCGHANDEKGKFGIANLASDLITAGAGKYDENALHDLMEENGIKIGFGVSKDDFSGYLITPKANYEVAKQLLKQIIFNPHLPENYAEITKAQMLKALQKQQEIPQSVLTLSFNKEIYGNHPYGRNSIGKAEDIKNLSPDDVRDYLKKSFAKQNLLIGIAGDINEEESQKFLTDVFAALPEESENKAPEVFDYESSGKDFNVERDLPQVIAVFSAKGTYRNTKDFYPLYFANYILGESGLTSRLNKVIREEKGLTYGIYSSLVFNDSSAFISGGFSADTENYEQAKSLLLEEWQKMALKGVSNEELALAKKSLIDSFNLRFADISGVSNMLVFMQKYNLGIDFLQKRNDYIRNVTTAEVNDAAARYFGAQPDFVTIGNNKEEK